MSALVSFEAVAAKRAPLALANVSLAWDAGVHAIVGGPPDGGPLLLELAAGWVRPRSGQVRVLDGSPADAGVRPQVAFVPLVPELPGGMRVGEVLAMASDLRGEPRRDAVERLAPLGLELLAPRRAETLSLEESRAVALAEAITSSRVRVLLVDEPFVGVDPRASNRLPAALRANAAQGRAVLLATASVRDAAEIADDHTWLERGSVVGRTASADGLARLSVAGARLRVVSTQARALSAALAREECVDAVARRDTLVTARGRDPLELSRALARAIGESGADVLELRVQPPSLDEVRAGMAAASEEAPP